MSIGKRIKELRLKLGLTQKAFANKIGVSMPSIQAWEYEKNEPNSSMSKKISHMYNISLSWLLTGEGEMFNNGKSLKLENITDEGELIEQIVIMLETKLKKDNTELPIKKKAEFIKEMFIDCRHLAKKEAQDKIISILKYIS